MAKANELNEKQKKFCEEYLIDFNGTRAAIAAGYSEKTARSTASENLTKPNIQEYLKKLINQRSERTKITQDEVVANIVEVMQRCMQAKPVMIFDKVEKEYIQETDLDGNTVWKFDSQGANKALDMLMKHTGGYKEDNRQQQANIAPIQKIFVTKEEEQEVKEHIRKMIGE